MKTLSKPFTVGITGGIGSGKTSVCRIFEQKGYPVFYSDDMAKKLVNSDLELKNAISDIFGEQAYHNESLNRSFIAEQVFSNPKLLEKLNQIVHPAVRKAFQEFKEAHKQSAFVFNEAAILFETGAYKRNDFNLLVIADDKLRVQRVMQRDQISEEAVRARMANQWVDEKKIPMADYIIENNGDDLEKQVSGALDFLIQQTKLN